MSKNNDRVFYDHYMQTVLAGYKLSFLSKNFSTRSFGLEIIWVEIILALCMTGY